MRKITKTVLVMVTAAAAIFFTSCTDTGKVKHNLVEPAGTKGNPVEAFGVIKPYKIREISAGFRAEINRINVIKGQKVTSGDVLADIDRYENDGKMESTGSPEKIVCDIRQGVVSEVLCCEGRSINTGECLFRVMDTSKYIVEANVDEQFIGMVKADARAVIIPDADRSHLYSGKVAFLSSLAETINGETTVSVQIAIDDADSFLIPGLNVAVKIDSN